MVYIYIYIYIPNSTFLFERGDGWTIQHIFCRQYPNIFFWVPTNTQQLWQTLDVGWLVGRRKKHFFIFHFLKGKFFRVSNI